MKELLLKYGKGTQRALVMSIVIKPGTVWVCGPIKVIVQEVKPDYIVVKKPKGKRTYDISVQAFQEWEPEIRQG